ncbi:MAG TPA: SHOCT domain-containing protein [Nitrosopumilaceae archaeon]|nr:SHOCT domain-containing protein [Nitrosopumilaceae archaeon]
MSEDMIKSIHKLIDSGKGDLKRLTEILNTLKQGATLYLSDYKYLENLFSQKEEPPSKIDSKNKVKKIKQKVYTKQKTSPKNKTNDALSVLKTRLASGEITLDEFQAIKKILKDN